MLGKTSGGKGVMGRKYKMYEQSMKTIAHAATVKLNHLGRSSSKKEYTEIKVHNIVNVLGGGTSF